MSKQIAVIARDRIARICVVLGRGRSLAQVKGDADYIINGGFYDTVTGLAVGHLKADGQVLARENWGIWGYAWNGGADISMTALPDETQENYISGLELITPGGKLSYNADVGGKRGRSALALTVDSLILYCSGDGTKDAATPEAVQAQLKELGAESAIMLDGGGSSQCDFQGGKINSSRAVHNYICVWLNKDEGKEGDKVKKVVLDPGHGVETAGKRAPDGSYYEHAFNLDMANRVKGHLERHGVEVVMTRSGQNDVTLAQRVKISNNAAPDLFVSIHSNASGETWSEPSGYGIYTSASGDNAQRNKAAKAILARVKAAGIPFWGNGLMHDISLYVLKNTTAPAVLIEHGFHTNREELALLKSESYRELLAKADAQGILDYLGIAWLEEKKGTHGQTEGLSGERPSSAESELSPTGGSEGYEACKAAVCPYCGGRLKIEKG